MARGSAGGGRLRQEYLVDPVAVHVEHLEAPANRLEVVGGRGDAPKHVHDQAAHRIEGMLLLAGQIVVDDKFVYYAELGSGSDGKISKVAKP